MSLFTFKSNEGSLLEKLSDFNSLFFPAYCLGCASGLVKGEDTLCTRCILELPHTGYIHSPNNPVKEKFAGRLPMRFAWAFLKFRKTGVVQKLLHQLKYNNCPEVGVRLGRIFGHLIKASAFDQEFDLIIPMPLHRSRQRHRGYNQSSMFADGLAQVLSVPWFENIVSRQVNTVTQTKKTKVERWENVRTAFRIHEPDAVRDQRILLVDDVITTGASIEACGQLMLDHGCKELSIACIAEAQ